MACLAILNSNSDYHCTQAFGYSCLAISEIGDANCGGITGHQSAVEDIRRDNHSTDCSRR